MTKTELEQIGQKIKSEDYDVDETVHSYYLRILDAKGKEQIENLWEQLGALIFLGMHAQARKKTNIPC